MLCTISVGLHVSLVCLGDRLTVRLIVCLFITQSCVLFRFDNANYYRCQFLSMYTCVSVSVFVTPLLFDGDLDPHMSRHKSRRIVHRTSLCTTRRAASHVAWQRRHRGTCRFARSVTSRRTSRRIRNALCTSYRVACIVRTSRRIINGVTRSLRRMTNG